MSNFNIYIDGSILLLYIIGTLAAGLWVRKYVKNVNDYLLAGRKVDLYLGLLHWLLPSLGL